MFTQLALLSLLSSAAFAQSSSSIPSGISSECSTFLESLNKNSGVSSCSSSAITATADFNGAATSATASGISSALDTLCSSNTCDSSTIRSALGDFQTACTAELTSSKNTEVIAIYDMLYTVVPMKSAICSKNDDGAYCVLHTSTSLTSSADTVQKYLTTDSGSPNMTTWADNSIPFLFISSSLSNEDLCTSCTRKVLTSYIQFMSQASYAPGITSSVLLNKESGLYSAVTSNCGSAFLSGVVQAAGGIGTGSDDADGALSVQMDVRIIAGALMGMLSAFAFY